jgi:hypothetical protein
MRGTISNTQQRANLLKMQENAGSACDSVTGRPHITVNNDIQGKLTCPHSSYPPAAPPPPSLGPA